MMETIESTKYVEQMKKAMENQTLNLKTEQVLLAKRFERNLYRSAKIAKTHEQTIKSFASTRRKVELELYQQAWKNAFTVIPAAKQKTELVSSSGMVKSPSEKLKEFHRKFQVPYKKEFSLQSSDLSVSAIALDIKCALWRKVSNCIEQKWRAQSAPPWVQDSKPPLRIQHAHTNALKTLGINRWLVPPLVSELQIDKIKLQKRRSKENKMEKKAINNFIETLSPLKIQPGPSQTIIDANELYRAKQKNLMSKNRT